MEQQASSNENKDEQYEGKNKDTERRMSHDRNRKITIGLVVAPGVTERLGESLIQELPDVLSRTVQQ